MKKTVYLKLMSMTLLLIVSIGTVVSASYAWLTLSESPTASGIQISLSGGSFILIAPDLATTVDGVTYHYPGEFSDTLNFAQSDSYGYLQSLGGLNPVSTADGIHWFLPAYFDEDDERVTSGMVSAGDLRPVQEFQLDDTLAFANLDAESASISRGHYVCLDFWVVSPGNDYKLRISTGDNGGTFVIDLLDPVNSGDTLTGLTLDDTGITSTSTSVRVGFLTSEQFVTDLSMAYYQQTAGYDESYTSLRGVYAEQGFAVEDPQQYSFLIYEPNADSHPGGTAENGAYVTTYPLAMVGGVPTPTNMLSRTTAQLTSWWVQAGGSEELLLEQVFQTALIGKQDYEAAAEQFYTGYLQYRFDDLIHYGAFIRQSSALMDYVSPERMQTLETAGATDDVYIVELQRNVPQRIRMFIWLEGQDADWDPSIAANSFAVSIELAGGSK